MSFVDELLGGAVQIVKGAVDIGVDLVSDVVGAVADTGGGFIGELGPGGISGNGGTVGLSLVPLDLLEAAVRFLSSPAGRIIGGGIAGISPDSLARQALALFTGGASADMAIIEAAGRLSGGNRVQLFTEVIAVMPDGREVVRSRERGTPFLMSRDFQIARRVFRTIRKAHSRLPSRTRKTSKSKMLTDAATDKAIRNAMADACPPKC